MCEQFERVMWAQARCQAQESYDDGLNMTESHCKQVYERFLWLASLASLALFVLLFASQQISKPGIVNEHLAREKKLQVRLSRKEWR